MAPAWAGDQGGEWVGVLPASLLYDYGNLFLQEVICGRKHSPEIKLNIPSPQKSGDSGGP